MIPIKLNGKKYNIKSIPELTTREFIELLKIEELNPLKYLSWQTGLELQIIFLSKIDDRIIRAIGIIPVIEKLPVPKYILGKKVKNHIIETIGQRFMIETNANKYQGYNLGIFVTAVALTRSMNIDEINVCAEKLYELPFIDVIPVSCFFFRTFNHGNKPGHKFLQILNRLIKMKR